MLIVADENLPAVADAFAAFGEVVLLPGRNIRAADARAADVLLTRSVTKVDAALLAGSRVRFVGSATIGTDHVDTDYLAAQGIRFAYAPGCNAVAAAEYVIAAVLRCAETQSIDLPGRVVGIIGCGNVGGRARSRLQALGLECIVCDPPRARREGGGGFVELAAIAQADIVTVHVPLVTGGASPTRGLIDEAFIQSLKPGCALVNTSRGAVVDESALKARLAAKGDLAAVLDVWRGEPAIDGELAAMATIATPHIAGYSADGKLRATEQLYRAWHAFNGGKAVWDYRDHLPPPLNPLIEPTDAADALGAVKAALAHVYDVSADDKNLRQAIKLPPDKRAAAFDRLRRDYRLRRECAAYRVKSAGLPAATSRLLRAFGFRLV